MKTNCLSFFLCAVGVLLIRLPLAAAIFNVADGDVPGLKAAIATANLNGQDDIIVLAPSGSYVLTTRDNGLNGLPQIGPDGGHSLAIHGNGALITRSSNASTPTFRIFYVASGGNLTLLNLQLTNGDPGTFHGGAIYNDGETAATVLTVDSCVISQCSGDYGGAIFNDGYNDPSFPPHNATVNMYNSTITGNTGTQYGGGIWNESGGIVLNVNTSRFIQNTAVRSAGAIQFDGSNGIAIGAIANCTFSQNSAGEFGGAVGVDGFSGNAILSIIACTFDQNSARSGGALDIDGTSGTAAVTLQNCTFTGNMAAAGGFPLMGGGGGGIELDGGNGGNSVLNLSSCTFTANSTDFDGGDDLYINGVGAGTTNLQIGNTILNSGTAGNNLVTNGTGTVTSQGYNLSSDDTGGGAGTAPGGLLNHVGDMRNTDPLLDPAGLKDNGGQTFTIALQGTSPAIDHGRSDVVSITGIDQRGEPRPFDDPSVTNGSGGDGSDIGAYEADVRITSEIKTGSNLTIMFTSILGRTYEVQSRPGLNSGMWSTVATTTPAPPINGTGGVVTVTVPNAIGGPGAGFYRVNPLP